MVYMMRRIGVALLLFRRLRWGMRAVNRQVAHYGLHVGQIILLAKHFTGKDWRSVSVPRGQSVEFNRQVASG